MEQRLSHLKEDALKKDALISDLMQERSELREGLREKSTQIAALENAYHAVSASLCANKALHDQLNCRVITGMLASY